MNRQLEREQSMGKREAKHKGRKGQENKEETEQQQHQKLLDNKQNQPLERPDLMIVDELGFETVEFKCWRCARTDLRERNTAEAIQRGGHKLFCMACDRPDLFEWDVEKLADGSKREYIRPLSARETYKRLSPEAHALAAKQAMVQCLRVRRDAILKMTAELEMEYMTLLPAIEIAERDVIEAQGLVNAMEHDQVSQKVASLEKLNADVARLQAEIAAANAANEAAATKAEAANPNQFKDDVMRKIKEGDQS